ncbi:AAA domain-containing protein [Chaetomium fimeti]|uniref:AAA domain-containing protein n=1 Tax=Chaetomium fimeti TaxID=1854472 RepID=A0AAE0LT89_9PEZI|nr:AAA domain-containing protein [Chaetomium fimeti]
MNSGGSNQQTPAAAPQTKAVWFKHCVVLGGGGGDGGDGGDPSIPVIAGGHLLGSQTSLIRATAVSSRHPHANSWVGFDLRFPLPLGQAVNEEMGFGVRYNLDRKIEGGRGLSQSEEYTLTIKFPRGQIDMTVEQAHPTIVKRFPGAEKLSFVSVRLHEQGRVRVDGFGMPYKNPEHPEAEGWVNRNTTMVENITLLDFLAGRSFLFAMGVTPATINKEWNDARLPPPFSYPYGTEHHWPPAHSGATNLTRYVELLERTKNAEMFRPAYSYDDDNSHVAVVTQSVIQDIFWIHQASEAIEEVSSPAYLVERDRGRYFVIVATTREFMGRYDAAWGRLAKECEVRLVFHDEVEGKARVSETWNCTIVEHPDDDLRTNHPVEAHEVILQAQVSGPKDSNFVPKFPIDLKDAARKVSSACQYLPTAEPTHVLPYQLSPAEIAEQEDRMALHRAVMRGQGFYDWMTRPALKDDLVQMMAPVSLSEMPRPTTRPLPVVNYLGCKDEAYINALFQEVLPGDRAPFREYLKNRTLGIGVITAAPGFGKTTLMSVAGLAMEATLGQVLASGSCNVSVDNLARRIDRTSRSVCARYNQGKAQDDPTRARHGLVVRGYNMQREVNAAMGMLKDPEFVPRTQPGKRKNPWTLELSAAYWLLVLLGCRGKRFGALHPDDSEALHHLQEVFNSREDLASLRAVATGKLTCQEFSETEDMTLLVKSVLPNLIGMIIEVADFLAMTPAQSVKSGYRTWVERTAQGVLVDEAGNMHRSDLGCIWGNCLLPDSEGNLYNRLAEDGGISALAFLIASGLPIYRLRVQLRMANGLFDWVAEHLYHEVNFTYAQSCSINRPEFQAGHILERLMQKHSSVRPPPTGKLLPVFVHCEGARVHVDERTGSKQCRGQVIVALDIAADLVREGVDPTKITVLSPYTANVHLIRELRDLPAYRVLVPMGEAFTVDSFRGQENDIIIVVMGTSFPQPGPGFTTDPHRLNGLLTRQRCGLVVVGNVDLRGPGSNDGWGAGSWRGKTKGGRAFLAISPTGERSWLSAPMLQHIHRRMIDSGRVVRMIVGADAR